VQQHLEGPSLEAVALASSTARNRNPRRKLGKFVLVSEQ